LGGAALSEFKMTPLDLVGRLGEQPLAGGTSLGISGAAGLQTWPGRNLPRNGIAAPCRTSFLIALYALRPRAMSNTCSCRNDRADVLKTEKLVSETLRILD
jgi:hypothetical protein